MTMTKPKRLIRLPVVEDKYKKKAGVYGDIHEGVFPPQIKTGDRSVAWLESEVDTIIDARVAGATKEELRALVQRLVAARQSGAHVTGSEGIAGASQ